MDTFKKNWLKFIIGLVACLVVRLFPFRPPNIEPILATQMPFSKAFGGLTAFLFAFLSVAMYDLLTHTLGVWSLITASTYGVLGLISALYFKNHRATALQFAGFAIFGTLFFDAVTGLSIGPLFFHQAFMGALLGQIPFTMMHLLGNVTFAVLLSPAVYRYIIKNKKLETAHLFKFKFT